jgi:DNA polymerase I-like protein with 3'-5' exonuclease and polymerase domains
LNVLTSDFENTTWNTGSPFDPRNKAVCLGYKHNDQVTHCEFTDLNNGQGGYDLYVFFNAKYDLHWYRRLGVDISEWKIWCCQLAEFILEGQKNPYPSLEDTAQKYGLGHKIDVIKLEYWDKGINTDAIPPELLSDYCKQDVDLTYAIYLKQLEQFQQNPLMFKLFKLACQDLLVLEEMEWNGLIYDTKLCEERSKEIDEKLKGLNQAMGRVYPDLSINWNSGDQLSCFLYGGVVQEEVKVFDGYYGPKAQKAGQPKFKTEVKYHILPQLVKPIKGSEVKKKGLYPDGTEFQYYKTDEATLRKLTGKAASKYVGPLLEISKLEKLNGTYYKGLPKIQAENLWKEGEIHGQFNQVVAATGRLSSSKPNLQNFAGDCLDVFISRY